MSFGQSRQRMRNVGRKGNQVFFMNIRKSLLISTVACILACWIPFQAEALFPDCERTYRIAFLGTSISSWNDLPHIVGKLFELAGLGYEETHIFLDGQSLVRHWELSQGPLGFFARFCPVIWGTGPTTFTDIVRDDPDFIILQDSTQRPARPDQRLETMEVLETGFAPALAKAQITPILFQTWAYAEGHSELGNFTEFWSSVKEGMEMYKGSMNSVFGTGDNPADRLRGSRSSNEPSDPLQALMAPIGQAFANLRLTNPELFLKLYRADKWHPNCHGTLLSAYIFFWTITGFAPPSTHLPQEWPDSEEVTYPTEEDANVLWQAAKESYCHYYAEEQPKECLSNPLL